MTKNARLRLLFCGCPRLGHFREGGRGHFGMGMGWRGLSGLLARPKPSRKGNLLCHWFEAIFFSGGGARVIFFYYSFAFSAV